MHSAFKAPVLCMSYMDETMTGGDEIPPDYNPVKEGINIVRARILHTGVESGAYLLTKRCQYIPVHRDSFDAPISPIVNVTPILRKGFVQEVCDDISRG